MSHLKHEDYGEERERVRFHIKIREQLKETSTLVLFSSPVLFGLLVGLIWGWIGEKLYPGGLPRLPNFTIGSCILFLWGLSGIVLIVRKEAPPMTLISIRGTAAVILGIIWIVFWWGLAFGGFWSALRSVYRH